MRKGLITESTLTDIADAIRQKNGEDTTYKPRDMALAIIQLPSNIINVGSNATVQNETLIISPSIEQ